MPTVTAGYNWTSGETVTPTKLNLAAEPSVVVTDNEVTTSKILDAAVTNAKIASGIDAGKLTVGTLPIARLADGAVTDAKLATGISASKLTTGTLPSARIANASIVFGQLSLPSNFPIQVVQAVKTGVQTINTGAADWVDVSSLSLTLTRRVASSAGAVRIQAAISASSNSGDHAVAFRIVRGSTTIGEGADAGSRISATVTGGYGGTHTNPSFVIDFIDNSPGATATVTYKIQARMYSAAIGYINRSNTDANVGDYAYRTISTMTLTELAP